MTSTPFRHRTAWTRLAVWALLLSALCPRSASAQSALPDPITGEDLMADMLLRLSEQALSGAPPEGFRPDQITRCEILLDLALELTPDSPRLLRSKINLATQTGDQAGMISALRRYVELRPEDDVYRLQLYYGEVGEIETLDGQLALLEDLLLSRQSPPLSDPLRSRIAVYAAGLAQELGNTESFLTHLKTAVRSDPTNGAAAEMTFNFAVEREASGLKLAAAAINLVRAKPLDSNSRLIMAEALSSLGVYDRACEQFEVATKLPRNEAFPEPSLNSWLRCLIASGDIDQARQLLDQIENLYSGAGRVDPETQEPVEPRPVPLSIKLQRRVLMGETVRGRQAYDDIIAFLQASHDAGNPDAVLDMAWIKAIFGPDTEEVTALLEGQDQSDPRYLRATGFVHMREGAERWARDAFESIALEDDVAAYGLALLQGKDDAGRARFLRDVVHQSPGSFGGLLAAHQLQQMRREVVPNAQGKAIIEAMNRLPTGLWRYDVDRNPWITVRATLPESRTQFLEPIYANITIQNTLGIPLAIDPVHAVDTNTFVNISAFTGGQPLGQIQPFFMDLRRQLTLGKSERLEIRERIDLSTFGLILIGTAPGTITYNVTFLVGPIVGANGIPVPKPLGGIDTVRSVQAFVPGYNDQVLDQWATMLEGGRELPRFTAMAMLARFGDNLTQEGLDPEIARRCINTLNASFEGGTPAEQAWALTLLTTDRAGRSEFQRMLDQAERSDDPLVRIAYLIRHIRDADDRALTTAIRDGSPRISRFAEAQRDFLSLPPPEIPEDQAAEGQ